MDKAYLDTCIISNLAKGDLSSKEQSVLVELLKLHKNDELHLVTSEITKSEIDKIPQEYKVNHEIIYLLLQDVPVKETKIIQDVIDIGIIPFPREDNIYTRLKNILPDDNDRIHVYTAIKNGCYYFITTDRRTILKHNKKLFLEFDEFMVLSPSEIMELLSIRL